MKTWTRTIGTAFTLALFTGCTVTVGNGNGDDTDDIDFTDKSEEPETTEDEDQTTDSEPTSVPEETSSEEVSSSPVASTVTSEPVSSSTAGETSSSPDQTSEPPTSVCDAEPEAASCDECVQTHCQGAWEACCGDEDCMAAWVALYTCMVAYPTDDPWSDFDNCAAGASETGDAFDLPDGVQYITSCVNAEYMGEDDDFHEPGDGTCTLACYNWDTLGDP